MIKNIVLSGGWGYGNLGDDAILHSSVCFLKQKFPNAKINILTYCIKDSKEVFDNHENLYFYESLDKKLFGYNYHPAPIGKTKIDDFKFAINKRLSSLIDSKNKTILKKLCNNTHAYLIEHKENLEEYTTLGFANY